LPENCILFAFEIEKMPGWPIYYKDQLVLGNVESNVAICTLWTRKEFIAKAIDMNKVAVIGNLYTVDGINYLIKNVLANPIIRYIILIGEDLMSSGESFIEFMLNGIDENYKIRNAQAYISKSIPRHFIEAFRNGVKIIDMRREPLEKLGKLVDSLFSEKLSPFADPVVITDSIESAESASAEFAGFRVYGSTLADAWLKLLDAVMKFGEIKESDYKIKQRELLDVVAVVEKPDKDELPEFLGISREQLEDYVNTFFSPSKPKGVEYTYGERLFAYPLSKKTSDKARNEFARIVDQISLAEEKLRSSPFTRRSVAVTWNVRQDISSENPPCLVSVMFNIKFGKLYLTAQFRSHDIYGAWFLNAYALAKLQSKVAKDLGVGIGKLIIFSVSAHVYENNWQKAKRIIEENYLGKESPFLQDPLGYFVIEIDRQRNVIVVRHKLNDGRDSGYIFEGTSAERLYKKVLHEQLVSVMEHAAYLGKELERAEQALKSGKEFVQDSA